MSSALTVKERKGARIKAGLTPRVVVAEGGGDFGFNPSLSSLYDSVKYRGSPDLR